MTEIDRSTGEPLKRIPIGPSADGIAVGGGSVWVTSSVSGQVTRVDERTGSVIGPVAAGSGADAVAIGPGAVWVANSLDGTVTRVDPASDSVAATIAVGDGPDGIAVTDGAVWVSNELSGTLTRIDPLRDIPVKTVTTGNRPEGIASVAGAVFVSMRASGAGHQVGTLTLLNASGDLGDGNPHLDPAIAYSQTDWQVAVLTNDGLTGFPRVGGSAGARLVPDLAVSLPVPTDGGRSYSFQLRPRIRYSTGQLVQPQDVRRGIERALLSSGGPGFYFDGVFGASACRPSGLRRRRAAISRGGS